MNQLTYWFFQCCRHRSPRPLKATGFIRMTMNRSNLDSNSHCFLEHIQKVVICSSLFLCTSCWNWKLLWATKQNTTFPSQSSFWCSRMTAVVWWKHESVVQTTKIGFLALEKNKTVWHLTRIPHQGASLCRRGHQSRSRTQWCLSEGHCIRRYGLLALLPLWPF